MSLTALDESTIPSVKGGVVAILRSKWHDELVRNMATACTRVLLDHGIESVEDHEVPGTLELPLAVRVLSDKRVHDAFVCLSVVEKGSTAHFDMIVHATTDALQRISIDQKVPVINEIIAVYDISDAIARASNDEFNKGIEAAAAALEMIDFVRTSR
ncbi:MAG: 6,7-dimethyl-8-ribityllumazine synthase [Gammaproteobacteria bacterium]|nr:6,7-dimethyl-8-ribityllumazine synthase [Gammaproteobacteria bacterium]